MGGLMWILKNGIPGTGMPQRVGKNITGEEGWNVIPFIRTLPFEVSEAVFRRNQLKIGLQIVSLIPLCCRGRITGV
jgi:hypothetical protein